MTRDEALKGLIGAAQDYLDLHLRLMRAASGIEAPSGDETRSGSAEGESPAPEGGDAQ